MNHSNQDTSYNYYFARKGGRHIHITVLLFLFRRDMDT